jgi:outer membrane protein TolC
MTTLAMVIGMLPIALAGNAGGELKSGLGWVLVGGLSSSMILTLVLVPAVYESLASVRERFMQWRTQRGSSTTAMIVANTATGVMGWIVAGMFIVSTITVQAQIPSTPLSLTEAIRRAKQENPDIRIAQLEQDAATERIRQVNGLFLPTVALEAQFTRNLRQPVFFLPSFGFDAGGNFIIDENNVQPVVAALRNNLSFSANLSMPLFHKELTDQQSLSETSALLTEEQRKAITETVVYETAKLYITILNLQEQKTLVTQNIQRAKETLAEAKSLFSKGLATDSDTLRAFVAVQTSTPQLRTIEVATESYKRQLTLLIGARADEIVVLTDSLAALPLPENALVEIQPDEVNTFVANRSDFKQILINEELIKIQRNTEKSRYLPSVALFANYTGQGQSNTLSFSQFPTSSALGLQFSWTIFDGFTREARIQEQEIRLQQTAIRREATARAITAEAKSAQEKLAETQKRVDSERGTVVAAERSYKAVHSRYKQGFSRQLDLADANLQLVQAKVQYVQALYELHLAALDVQKAQGLLVKD